MIGDGRSRRSGRDVAMGAVLVCAAALFAALGVWQVQRLAWKRDLIASVEQRVHAEPAPVPGPSTWTALTPGRDTYRRVRVRGVFLNDRETLVQAVTRKGPGFWVMTPLRSDDGFTVLVDRGFVPAEAASGAIGRINGKAVVTGLLRLTEPGGGFLRRNDPAAHRWYSRDVAAINAADRVRDAAPYFVDAEATPGDSGWPLGGLTVIQFRNSHLSYALTWFALAVMSIAWLHFGLRKGRRLGRGV